MLTVALMIAGYWLLLSAVTTACFCWLLKSKRIQFHEIVDRSEFDRGWGARK